MKIILSINLTSLLVLQQFFAAAQTSNISLPENDANNPCITREQYAYIENQCNKNAALFIHTTSPIPLAVPQLNWPLQAAPGFTDCSFYFISAHVDHDNTSAIKDYNCGTITYNGHRGTDIAIGPFPFYKMDNNQVQVIAAAPGTIIDKHDGEFDKNCVGVGSNVVANYMVVQHADGSRAMYWHMKKNSLTSKAIGQTLVAGEFIGIVGSSGSSSGPHLHFEVWAGNTVSTLVDPFSGTCNILNAATWWANQKPYTEPAAIKASVHTTDIVLPACPATETLNESTSYLIPFQGAGLSPGYAKFYVFIRNATVGTSATMNILNPNGSIFASWIQNYTTAFNFSYWGYSKKLPLVPGTYTFQANYNNISCAQKFDIVTCAPGVPTTWLGTASQSWETPANWSCGFVPDSTTNVIVNTGVANFPLINSNASCKSIKINPAASLKINTGFKLKVYQ